jgi:hypothetical protein
MRVLLAAQRPVVTGNRRRYTNAYETRNETASMRLSGVLSSGRLAVRLVAPVSEVARFGVAKAASFAPQQLDNSIAGIKLRGDPADGRAGGNVGQSPAWHRGRCQDELEV